MSTEIPSREALIEQITLLNARLDGVTSTASDQRLQPFQEAVAEEMERVVFAEEEISFPAFWMHYLIGSSVAHVTADFSKAEYKKTPVDIRRINSFQRRASGLIGQWIEDPSRIKTPQELATCISAQKACKSFQWATNLSLFHQLTTTMSELGNTYSMLISGERLLGFD